MCRANVCAGSPPSSAFGARPSRARSSRSPVACVRLGASRCSRLRQNRISSRPRGALLPRAFCAPGARNNSSSSACRAWGGPPSFAPPTGRRPSAVAVRCSRAACSPACPPGIRPGVVCAEAVRSYARAWSFSAWYALKRSASGTKKELYT